MGGKSKQSQRTKNNVRPSSSGRSAELLNSSVKLHTNVGFSGKVPALFPTFAGTINLEQGLNSELAVCLKKLNKKDPITKTKALNELCELVKNTKIEDVILALPSWVHHYRLLSLDTDRKVREAVQICHGAVMLSVGRRVAPHLKQLVPIWLQAQYDEYPPAAAAAHAALMSTFPDKKLAELISFCKSEVITHILENLIGKADELTIKKIENVEERETQYCRILTSSLQGLEYFVQNLPTSQSEWLWGEMTAMLQSNDYWKLSSHKLQQVRLAWYAAMGRIIERYKDLWGTQYGQKFTRIVLSSGKDQPAAVSAQIWACLLLIMHNIEEWHTWLDKKELLAKRILDVLENGGWGDARHLSNILLPLLASLPRDVLSKDFYLQFFNAIFSGLEKKSVINSKIERQMWVSCVAECLRYLSMQENEYTIEVVTVVHRTWLEKALSMKYDQQIIANLIKCTVANMTAILKYWLKKSQEENLEKFDQLTRNFWQNIGSTMAMQIEKLQIDNNDIEKLLGAHILFFQALKVTFLQEPKQKPNITFEGDAQVETDFEVSLPLHCDVFIIERYKHNLNELAEKIIVQYFEYMEKQMLNVISTQLVTLLQEFDTKRLYLALARHFSVNSFVELYEKVLMKWLCSETMQCKSLVDILFLMMGHLTDEEQTKVLNSFDQLPDNVREWCVRICVSHPACGWASVRAWACGRQLLARELSRATLRVLRAPHAAGRTLLLVALAHVDTLVPASTISELVSLVCESLHERSSPMLEQRCSLAAHLVTTLAAYDFIYPLVVELFTVNLFAQWNAEMKLSTECIREMRSAWQDGADTAQRRHEFLQHATRLIHQQLFQQKDTINIREVEHTVSLCPYLVNQYSDDRIPDDIEKMKNVTKLIFEFRSPDHYPIEAYALKYDILKSKINCLFIDNDITKTVIETSNGIDQDIEKYSLVSFLKKFLFRALFLKTIFCHKTCVDDEAWCTLLLMDGYFVMEFSKLLHDHAILNALYEGYAFSLYFDLIKDCKKKADLLLEEIISNMTKKNKCDVLTNLSEFATKNGFYWAYGWKLFDISAFGSDSSKSSVIEIDVGELEKAMTGNGFFHSLQANVQSDTTLRSKYLVMVRSLYAAYSADSAILDEQFLQDVSTCVPEENLNLVVNAYYRHNHIMLYDRDFSDCEWSQVVSNASILDYLRCMVDIIGWETPEHHWDFTTITLCSILRSLNHSKQHWASLKVSLIGVAAFRLLCSVSAFVTSIRSRCEKQEPTAHVANLPNEWNDIFLPDLNKNLIEIILYILDENKGICNANSTEYLRALADSCRWLLPPNAAEPLSPELIKATYSLGTALPPPYHQLAYRLLQSRIEAIVLYDAEQLMQWSENTSMDEDAEEDIRRPELVLSYFDDTLQRWFQIMEAALPEVKVGEELCSVEMNTELRQAALGGLLLLDCVLAIVKLARADTAQHYIQFVRERGYAGSSLSVCMRLLDERVLAACAPAAPTSTLAELEPLFQHDLPFDIYDLVESDIVGALSCRVIAQVVGGACASGARDWCAAAEGGGRLLRAMTARYVTPRLLRVLLQPLHARLLPDAHVSVHMSSREVIVWQQVDGHRVELTIQLAVDHPLTPPRLSTPPPPAPSTHFISLYLNYQNGTILGALKMWVSVLTRRVEGVSQCYICYCRLHPRSAELPRRLCRQCNNKFHHQCLRKWFRTSNKSNCPLCRAHF